MEIKDKLKALIGYVLILAFLIIIGLLIGSQETAIAEPIKYEGKRLSIVYQDSYYDGLSNNAHIVILQDNNTGYQYLGLVTTQGAAITLLNNKNIGYAKYRD